VTTIGVEILGLDRLRAGLDKIEQGVTVLRPLWERMGQEFYGQEKKLFDLAPWKPLSPDYAKRKRAKYGDKPILRATDTLFRSLTAQGTEGNVHRVGNDQAEFGSSVSHGIFHAESRPPLAEPDVERYDTIAGEYAAKLVREAGFS
jgi:hypothetical protein